MLQLQITQIDLDAVAQVPSDGAQEAERFQPGAESTFYKVRPGLKSGHHKTGERRLSQVANNTGTTGQRENQRRGPEVVKGKRLGRQTMNDG